MNYLLNPYVLVLESEEDNTYSFLFLNEVPIQVKKEEKTNAVMADLMQGEIVSADQLKSVFGESIWNRLLENSCFITEQPDTQSMFSRSDAFFRAYGMPEARKRIQNSRVLILGAGGIGSHMAWHMTVLGVPHITLVDYDLVEQSNLNRQLFDTKDVGKVKTQALKEKLQAINPDVCLNTINTKISSEGELESICTAEPYDLIIKALDTPKDFPLWLDAVAKKHQLSYISGITFRNKVLIGPTYLPGTDSRGWSDLIDLHQSKAQKVFGISASLGIMLYHIADELAMEAFRILSGYGKIQYANQIICKDVLTGEIEVMGEANPVNVNTKKSHSSNTKKELILGLILVLLLSVCSISQKWLIPLTFISAVVLPFVICRSTSSSTRATFLFSSVCSFSIAGIAIGMIQNQSLVVIASSALGIIAAQSVFILVMCGINILIRKLISNRYSKEKSQKEKMNGI